MSIEDQVEVFRRWANGEPRQFFNKIARAWQDATKETDCWYADTEYRIKPKAPREFAVFLHKTMPDIAAIAPYEQGEAIHMPLGWDTNSIHPGIRVREVIE